MAIPRPPCGSAGACGRRRRACERGCPRLGAYPCGAARRGSRLVGAGPAPRLARPALPPTTPGSPRRRPGGPALAARELGTALRPARRCRLCRQSTLARHWRCSDETRTRGTAGPGRAGRTGAERDGPPAGQLLDQPPQQGQGLGRPRGRALRARRGGDPHHRAAGTLARGGDRAKAGGAAAQPEPRRGRPAGGVAPARAAAELPVRSGGTRDPALRAAAARSCPRPPAGELRDNTFADRVGWKAVVSEPGSGTAVRTNAPSGDPTNGLRRYPEDLLDSPLDRREARSRSSQAPGL